jgi:hypothetical protein
MQKIITSLLLCTILAATAHEKPEVPCDFYFRKLYCNDEFKRSPITELPEYLIDACEKSGVNPADIHVFNEDSYTPLFAAHTVGSNIMLTNRFWQFDEDVQAWYFAHELSHTKYDNTDSFWQANHKLVDFQIGSTAVGTASVTAQLLIKKIRNIPAVIGTVCIWGLANVAALYDYYQKNQEIELRANDDASRAVGPEAGIKVTHQHIWDRNAGNKSTINRLEYYADQLGFSTHGSLEVQLARLEKIKKEMESK